MIRRSPFKISSSLLLAALVVTLMLLHLASTASAQTTGKANARRALPIRYAAQAATAVATPDGGLPDDATPLALDKPLTETLDEKTAIRFYKFDAKTGDVYRLSVEVKTGNFWTTTTIASANFERVLGATGGDTLIDSTMRVVIPEDTTYGITVEYVPSTIGTPAPGTYTITLSKVK